VFMRFRQLGSARQVLLSLAAEEMHFPRPSDGKTLVSFDWTPIRYRNIISILKNPFYSSSSSNCSPRIVTVSPSMCRGKINRSQPSSRLLHRHRPLRCQ
jgi:hypothetical protein